MSDTPFAPFQPSPPTQPEPPAEPRQKRKKAAEAAAPAEPRQKRKKAAGDKPGIKIDIGTAMDVAALLNAEDRPAFEELVAKLQEVGKPARDRLLAAIGKLFP